MVPASKSLPTRAMGAWGLCEVQVDFGGADAFFPFEAAALG